MAGIIEYGEMERYMSPYGNHYEEISIAEVVEMLQGKVLYMNNGEYSTFVKVIPKHSWED
jgi:hypothetical protein